VGRVRGAVDDAGEFMNTIERICQEVSTLDELQAQEVLTFVRDLKAQLAVRREAALATLAKYRGRVTQEKVERDELYDRKGLL
jgi:hypothetical protein